MRKIIRAFLSSFIFFGLYVKANAQSLKQDEIQVMAQQMLIDTKYKATVKKVFPPVGDLQVALLSVPYRDYPSIVIFKRNKDTGKWQRIFECLSPGLQDAPTGLLDWHTKGLAVDFELGKNSINHFDDKQIKTVLDVATKKGILMIPYQRFFHMSNFPTALPLNYAAYTIDKTQYLDFANQLFNDSYKKYPTSECTMYDTPQIINCEFGMDGDHFVIKAITNNKQVWVYSFNGVDAKNQYLVNKIITVKAD